MQQRDLARLLVKIAGLVIVVSALTDLPIAFGRVFASKYQENLFEVVAQTIAPAGLSILAGLVMYWGAGSIVDRVLLARGTSPIAPPTDFRAIEEIALAVLGIYVFSSGLAEGVYYWGKWDLFYRYAFENGYSAPPIPQTEFAGIGAAATRLVVGTALFLWSRGIVGLRRCLIALRPTANAD